VPRSLLTYPVPISARGTIGKLCQDVTASCAIVIPLVAHSCDTQAQRMCLSSIHGGWHKAVGVALFGDIPDAREGEVIADERELIL
jgi:hypothetical protein